MQKVELGPEARFYLYGPPAPVIIGDPDEDLGQVYITDDI